MRTKMIQQVDRQIGGGVRVNRGKVEYANFVLGIIKCSLQQTWWNLSPAQSVDKADYSIRSQLFLGLLFTISGFSCSYKSDFRRQILTNKPIIIIYVLYRLRICYKIYFLFIGGGGRVNRRKIEFSNFVLGIIVQSTVNLVESFSSVVC